MKPTCLTPGCVLPFDHTVAHSKTETEPYAGFREPWRAPQQSESEVEVCAGFPYPPAGPPLPTTPPVTLEGLAAVISAAGSLLSILDQPEDQEAFNAMRADLVALSAKAREVACGTDDLPDGDVGSPSMVMSKEDMDKLVSEHIAAHLKYSTAGEAVRSVHQRIAAMPEDELERHAEAIAAWDDAEAKKDLGYPAGYAAGYNRAVIDAANVLPDVYGAGSEDAQAVEVQHGIMALHKAGVGEMRMAVTQVDE